MSSRLTRCVAVVSLVSCVLRHRDKNSCLELSGHTLTRPLIGGAVGNFLPRKLPKRREKCCIIDSSKRPNAEKKREKAIGSFCFLSSPGGWFNSTWAVPLTDIHPPQHQPQQLRMCTTTTQFYFSLQLSARPIIRYMEAAGGWARARAHTAARVAHTYSTLVKVTRWSISYICARLT